MQVIFPRVDNMIWDKRVFVLKPGVIEEIEQSFVKVGQLQPIVVIAPDEEDGPYKLNIGRHRYQAVKNLYKKDPLYIHKFLGREVPAGCIPALDVRDIPVEMLLNMEIAENVHRMDLSWQEKTAALAMLHEIEKREFEKKKASGEVAPNAIYTISATAKKLAGITGGAESHIRAKVSQALIVADQLSDPEIAKSESARAAFTKVATKMTAQARIAGADFGGQTPHRLIKGDCIEEMVKLTKRNLFDLILSDPPYGIGADTYDNMGKHKYDDSWANAERLYAYICTYGYDLTQECANLLLFCSPEHWHKVRDMAEAAGWTPWFRPVIWLKSTEGMRPWGQKGFAYTYECVMWATKGRKGLVHTHVDTFSFYKVPPSQREHAAAKPLDLIKKLMEICCIPGDTVLDPCVGSGVSFKAGTLLNLAVTGIEKEESVYPIAEKNLYWTADTVEEERVDPGADSLADL